MSISASARKGRSGSWVGLRFLPSAICLIGWIGTNNLCDRGGSEKGFRSLTFAGSC
jgi:hypothetical protein